MERAIGQKFQDSIGKLLRELKFEVKDEYRPPNSQFNFDFLISKDDKRYLVEVKYFSKFVMKKGIEKFIEEYKKVEINYYRGIFICNHKIEQSVKDEYLASNIIIIDAVILDYLANSNFEFKKELSNYMIFANEVNNDDMNLQFSLGYKNYLDELGLFEIPNNTNEQTKSDLLCRFNKIPRGEKGWRQYEDLCFDIIRYLFMDDLFISEKSRQEITEDGLNRFDYVCRVKKHSEDGFWEMIDGKLNSRYVVFEFKNYSEKISQGQIYTTEKYLYGKSLRTVAFIFSREGVDENAEKAIRGIVRETGKLIISITDKDLKEMIEKKESGEHEVVLYEKLDDFFIRLGK